MYSFLHRACSIPTQRLIPIIARRFGSVTAHRFGLVTRLQFVNTNGLPIKLTNVPKTQILSHRHKINYFNTRSFCNQTNQTKQPKIKRLERLKILSNAFKKARIEVRNKVTYAEKMKFAAKLISAGIALKMGFILIVVTTGAIHIYRSKNEIAELNHANLTKKEYEWLNKFISSYLTNDGEHVFGFIPDMDLLIVLKLKEPNTDYTIDNARHVSDDVSALTTVNVIQFDHIDHTLLPSSLQNDSDNLSVLDERTNILYTIGKECVIQGTHQCMQGIPFYTNVSRAIAERQLSSNFNGTIVQYDDDGNVINTLTTMIFSLFGWKLCIRYDIDLTKIK